MLSARPDISPRAFGVGVGACAAAVAAFLAVQLTVWPPHEDETLALFVGREPLGEALDTVLGQRGGAPLHFLLAWIVAHAGGGLTELRVVSALLAVASVPAVALLAARLAGRTVGLGTTILVSGSWVLLFHGIYARMYSLFLLLSTLSYLALLRALERGGRGNWTLWGVAVLATIATHPYGAIVLATQAAYVAIRRVRVREAAFAFGAVFVLALPFWRTDVVLAGRFDVGVGEGGARLGAPWEVLAYLWQVAGDFSAGWWFVLAAVLALAALGLRELAREERASALLAGCVFAVPAVALTVARLGDSASPESRHLIFALPFFSTLVAAGVVQVARRKPRVGPAVAVLVLAGVLGSEVAWARVRTPPLFTGEPASVNESRRAAAGWLAATMLPDDVFFGYEPVYLRAWERTRQGPHIVVPRADPKLALRTLQTTAKPLGRGVWVFDASEPANADERLSIRVRLPRPESEFEARRFGPYLVVRTLRPTRTARRYLVLASQVMIVGKDLRIGDADLNFTTVRRALARLDGRWP